MATIPLALIAAGTLVATSSYSAFSATTTNPADNWTAGSVALTNSAPNSAAFSASNLVPGSTGTACIAVTSTGSVPATVKLYGSNASQTQSIGDWITLQVTQGTGGGNGSCSGFSPLQSGSSVFNGTLSSFMNNATNYSTGLGAWNTVGGTSAESRTYQFSYSVASNAPSSIMGGSANVGFTWEAQNQ